MKRPYVICTIVNKINLVKKKFKNIGLKKGLQSPAQPGGQLGTALPFTVTHRMEF